MEYLLSLPPTGSDAFHTLSRNGLTRVSEELPYSQEEWPPGSDNPSDKGCGAGGRRLAAGTQVLDHEVPPAIAWKRPGLPTQWTRVLERNPDAMKPEPLPGYVWLDTPGKVLHVQVARLEFRNGPPV